MNESANRISEEKRREIVRILSNKIQSSEGNRVKAAAAPGLTGVSKDDYGYGPGMFTTWFKENFPEFLLEDGVITINPSYSFQLLHETGKSRQDEIEAGPAAGGTHERDFSFAGQSRAAVVEILTNKIHESETGSILSANAPGIIGVSKDIYGYGPGMFTIWFKENFPEFILEDGEITLPSPVHQNLLSSDSEIQQMHHISYMKWWSNNLNRLRPYGITETINATEFRDRVAGKMASAILTGGAGFIDATAEEIPRFAFETGLVSSQGKPIYCVIGENPMHDQNKQYWILIDFCYPGEVSINGLGSWLKRHLPKPNVQFSYSDIDSKIQEAALLKNDLIPQVQTWADHLASGIEPDPDFCAAIEKYSECWAELRKLVDKIPALNINGPLSLDILENLTISQNVISRLLERAADLFRHVIDAVGRIYDKYRFRNGENSTLAKDLVIVERAADNPTDTGAVEEFQSLLDIYNDLLTVMCAEYSSDVGPEIERVTEHFTEVSFQLAIVFTRASEEDRAFQNDLEEARAALRQYYTEKKRIEENRQTTEESISAEELFLIATSSQEDWRKQWISIAGRILSRKTKDKLYEKLSAENNPVHQPGRELTPYSAGLQLLSMQNNLDSEAEKCFLLGLLFDSRRCAPQLLKIYREENCQEKFMKIWHKYAESKTGVSLSDDDQVFLLMTLCQNERDSIDWDNLERFLQNHQSIMEKDRALEILKPLAVPEVGRPYAFWAWLGLYVSAPNTLESAIAENGSDQFFAILDDGEKMLEMGYLTEEIPAIRTRLECNTIQGLDNYSKAQRLINVLGYQNRVAENYLWASSTNENAQRLLFDIYVNRGDDASVCWIVSHLSLDFCNDIPRLRNYTRCLAAQKDSAALLRTAATHPEVWFIDGVLQLLADADETKELRWKTLLEWHQMHPLELPNPFEKALENGVQDEICGFLEDEESMEAWGYTRDQAKNMKAISVSWPEEHDWESVSEVAARISRFQGNQHRFLEDYLLRQMERDLTASRKALFALMCSEKRYQEAIAYYREDPKIFLGDLNKAHYLRCLIELRDFDTVSKEIDNNPKLLQKDQKLAQDVFQLADACGHHEFADQMSQVVNRMAWNRFEENLINLNAQIIQEMVSDQAQLLELGYSQKEISWFKDCLSKPFPKGADSFSVGSRMRLFFGDRRAEQFFIDAGSDPRALKALFSIYCRGEEWDKLCYFYRAHVSEGIWDREESKEYILALSKASQADNCQEFLQFIRKNPNLERSNTETKWLYLKSLAGAHLWDEMELREAELISSLNGHFRVDYIVPFFDILWNIGSKQSKEHAVMLSGRLLDKGRSCLTSDELQQLITVNGHLPVEKDEDLWGKFLLDNGLEEMLCLLCATCSFGLRGDPDREAAFCGKLIEFIYQKTGDFSSHELAMLSQLLKWEDLDETALDQAADVLLREWKILLLPKEGSVSLDHWDVFLSLLKTGPYVGKWSAQATDIWTDAMNYTDDLKERTALVLTGVRQYLMTLDHSAGAGKASLSKMADRLTESILETCEQHELHIQDSEWRYLSRYFQVVSLSAEQCRQLITVWMNYMDTFAVEGMVFYREIIAPLEARVQDWEYATAAADHLAKRISELIRGHLFDQNDKLYFSVRDSFEKLPLDYKRAKVLAGSFIDQDPVYFPELLLTLVERMTGKWTGLAYQLLKAYCLAVEDHSEEYHHALHMLMREASALNEDLPSDTIDQNLLYEAAKLDHTDDSLLLLKECFEKAGKSDQAGILTALCSSRRTEEDADGLEAWFIQALSEHSIQWIERYSAWWAPLVQLSQEDIQIKGVASYLGLTDEPVSKTLRKSVLRLLVSNLRNVEYLKCFLRIYSDFPQPAKGRLEYFTALEDPNRIDTTIEGCTENGQYDLALNLLLKKMGLTNANSSPIGQMLGVIYTPENIRKLPSLADQVPDVFCGIVNLNQADTQGIWKNLGRAVDIACITGNERAYFDVFGRDVAREYPGKSAALVANLIINGRFDDARECLAMTAGASNALLSMTDEVLRRCVDSGTLSGRDELLMRIIPREGNNPSMESYGYLTSYAFDRGWRTESAWAMVDLLNYFGGDRSLLAACQHLSPIIVQDWGIQKLYELSKQYLSDVALPYALTAAKSLAILQCCLPDGDQGRADNVTLLYGCRSENQQVASQETAHLINYIMRIRDDAERFLTVPGNATVRSEILIRAAVGWWRIDAGNLDLILNFCHENGPEHFKALVEIYPQSFAAACYRHVLLNRNDEVTFETIRNLLIECDMRQCAEILPCVQDISAERIAAFCKLLDRPFPIAGLNTATLQTVMQNENMDQAENELMLLFASRPSLTYQSYRNNADSLKEIVESKYPKYRTKIPRILARLSTMDSSHGRLGDPSAYLQMRDYAAVAKAAEQALQRDSRPYPQKLNRTYQLLGEIMTDQCDERQLSTLKLYEVLNMANVLCSSPAYSDLETLMDICQIKPKWKICVRCLQELIQGCPRNVLNVLRDETFLLHTGCTAAVIALIKGFVGGGGTVALGEKDTKTGLHKLQLENRSSVHRRADRWGYFTDEELSSLFSVPYPRAQLLYANQRNPVEFQRSFSEDIEDMLKDLRMYDEEHGIIEENPRDETNFNLEEQPKAYKEFRRVPYVTEQVERWKDTIGLAEEREALELQEQTEQDISQRIECLGKLIALDWNSEGNVKTCLYCVELGLCLFDQQCERSGYHVVARSGAREILFAVSAVLPGIYSKNRFSEMLKNDIQICLSSYEELSSLITDCGKPALTELCMAITDTDVQKEYLSFIALCKEFSESMSKSVNNSERLRCVKTYIDKSDKLRSPIISSPVSRFVYLLNQQIQQIQGSAVVNLVVYNETASVTDDDSAFIFGQVSNTGSADAEDVQIELLVDGVFSGKYILDYLPGNSRIPFELKFKPENCEPESTVSYTLAASYRFSGEKDPEQTRPFSGELVLVDPEEEDHKYDTYQVTRPVEGEDYQERTSILKTLNAYYGGGKSFDEFPNLAIYGMRRTGKSSILRRTQSLIQEMHGDSILFVSVSGEGTQGDSVAELAHIVMVKQVIERLKASGSHLAGPEWDAFCTRWLEYPVEPGKFEWLDDYFTELTRNWTKDYGFMILVDEVERLYKPPQKEADVQKKEECGDQPGADDPDDQSELEVEAIKLWDILSRIVQRPGVRLRFILCGSDHFTNTVNQGDNLTQFFQRIKKLSIGRMTQSEIEKTMRRAESKSDIRFHPDAIDCLWFYLKGLPWHSKHLGNHIIEKRLIPTERTQVYPSDILWSVEAILNSNALSSDNTFGLSALSSEERIIVDVLARELSSSVATLSSGNLFELVSQEANCEAAQFDRAIKMLVSERQLLVQSSINRVDHYQFGCELYRLYLRRQKTLNKFVCSQ